uniref:intramembrane prenyl-peptidase Rce1 n=1 Tax=Helicotheca tamesis TaxID=374047 RepID=A0A7S2IJ61_9STRA
MTSATTEVLTTKLSHRLLTQCQHKHLPLRSTIPYCAAVSTCFVLCLYIFVPSTVRRLPRDDVRHIKWRLFAVFVFTTMSICVYPFIFCFDEEKVTGDDGGGNRFPALHIMGWSPFHPARDLLILLHVCCLYLGPFVASFLKIHVARKNVVMYDGFVTTTKRGSIPPAVGYIQATREVALLPLSNRLSNIQSDPALFWGIIRDLIVAPFAEEIVFRGMIVPALLSSHLSPTTTSWVSPLFFGTAHLHHAYLRLQSKLESTRIVWLTTLVQFSYTSLFGAYVSHAFLRTGSLVGVTLGHSFCNYWGLPNLGFLSKTDRSELSCVYGFRWIISVMYVIGMIIFGIGFRSGNWSFFPEESVLPSLLLMSE